MSAGGFEEGEGGGTTLRLPLPPGNWGVPAPGFCPPRGGGRSGGGGPGAARELRGKGLAPCCPSRCPFPRGSLSLCVTDRRTPARTDTPTAPLPSSGARSPLLPAHARTPSAAPQCPGQPGGGFSALTFARDHFNVLVGHTHTRTHTTPDPAEHSWLPPPSGTPGVPGPEMLRDALGRVLRAELGSGMDFSTPPAPANK